MLQFLYLLFLIILLLLTPGVRAQGDTLRPGKGGLVTQNLQPGTRDGRAVFNISQRWYFSDNLDIETFEMLPALTPDVRGGFAD